MIITIGRQFGSGGRDVGEKIAEKLGMPFYDKELVEMAAQKSNLSADAVKEIDERATNSFLYSLVGGNYSMRGINAPIYYEMPINDKLFIAQSEIIKDLAKKQDCVFVGRCADYALEKEANLDVLSIFIYADHEFRIHRVMKSLDLPYSKARDRINKTDKQRRTYYEYYTSRDWGVMGNYDMCLNTGSLGIDNAADLVVNYIKNR